LRAISPEELAAPATSAFTQGQSTFKGSDLILAELVIVTPSPRDYVVLDDPLPAGFEAVDTTLATTASWLDVSQPRGDYCEDCGGGQLSYPEGAPSRRELRDDRALFFMDRMQPGMHRYRYLARATTLGRFVVPPTKVEEMYAPEVFGRTGAGSIEVR
jgi:alpha-2-macroglobulin